MQCKETADKIKSQILETQEPNRAGSLNFASTENYL